MRVSSIEARLRMTDVDWHQPVREFVLEGLDEIAAECRPRWQDTKQIPMGGLSLPNVQVTKITPSSQSGGYYDGRYRGITTYWYGYGDEYRYPLHEVTPDVAFEQTSAGLLTLFDDELPARARWLIRGTPWWSGMRTLAEALDSGTEETATVTGTAPDLYIDLDPTWEYVTITGPDMRVLTEGRDYTRKGDRVTFTSEVSVESGDVLNLEVWLSANDVELGTPKWVVECLQARLRWHLEEAVFGTHQGTVSAHEVKFGPVSVKSGDQTSALTRAASGLGVVNPAQDYYWRLLHMHGARSSGLA